MSIKIEKLQPSILFSVRNSEMVRFTKIITKKNSRFIKQNSQKLKDQEVEDE